MSKFDDILKGRRAVRVVEFPQFNMRSSLLAPLPEQVQARDATQANGTGLEPVSVGLRVLDPDEEDAAEAAATKRVRALGIEPVEGMPAYDRAIIVQTLLLACLDVESDQDNPEPFFSSAAQLTAAPMDSERLAYLWGHYCVFRDECGPQAMHIEASELYSTIHRIATDEGDAIDFLGSLRPGLQWRLLRTLAVLWSNSVEARSQRSPSSAPSSTKPPTPKGSKRKRTR